MCKRCSYFTLFTMESINQQTSEILHVIFTISGKSIRQFFKMSWGNKNTFDAVNLKLKTFSVLK